MGHHNRRRHSIDERLRDEARYQEARALAVHGEIDEALRLARQAERDARAWLATGEGEDALYLLWREIVDTVRALEREQAKARPAA